jgi:hypothetical protein
MPTQYRLPMHPEGALEQNIWHEYSMNVSQCHKTHTWEKTDGKRANGRIGSNIAGKGKYHP